MDEEQRLLNEKPFSRKAAKAQRKDKFHQKSWLKKNTKQEHEIRMS